MAAAPPYAFLAGLALASALLAGAGLWALTRRRSALAQRAAAALTVALVVLALVPAPSPAGFAFLEGTLTGEARVPVDAHPRAPLVVDGGTGSVENGELVLDCPDGCTFRLGTNARRVPPLALPATLEGIPAPTAEVHGGPLVVVDKHGTCFRSPFLLVLAVAGSSCTDCTAVAYASGAEAGGPRRLVERPPQAC